MELLHLLIGDFYTLGVGLGNEMSTEAQTCRRPVMMPAARLLEPSPKTPFFDQGDVAVSLAHQMIGRAHAENTPTNDDCPRRLHLVKHSQKRFRS